MSNRVINEGKSFRGSMIYLTGSEKEALKRAIDQYERAVGYSEDEKFKEFFDKYDRSALESAFKKIS